MEVVSTGLVIRTLSVETAGKEGCRFYGNVVVSMAMLSFLWECCCFYGKVVVFMGMLAFLWEYWRFYRNVVFLCRRSATEVLKS